MKPEDIEDDKTAAAFNALYQQEMGRFNGLIKIGAVVACVLIVVFAVIRVAAQ